MKASEHGVKAIGVRELPTDSLRPNPHNPRMLFDDVDMGILRESIKKVGILVPLTVYEDKDGFVILDGQRRWMCAQKLNRPTVPVNIIKEPSLVQNIVTMFQIHKLRKDWDLMPTALKLALLMEELHEKRDEQLSELTGLEEAVVVRCKKLLSYDRRYQDLMLDPVPEKRVKADFFIELYPVRTDRVVNKFPWFRKDPFTDKMLEKQKAKGIRAVTDFRVVKQHINNAAKANRTALLSEKLRQFADNPELPPEHLNIESAKVVAEARKVQASVEKLYSQVNSIDVQQFFGQDEMWNRLDALAKLIRAKLRELGRREGE